METAEEKLAWLEQAQLSRLLMEGVRPNTKANWINQTDNDFDKLIASIDKKTNLADVRGHAARAEIADAVAQFQGSSSSN